MRGRKGRSSCERGRGGHHVREEGGGHHVRKEGEVIM